MKKVITFGATLLSGVIIATAMTSTAYAWHPKGQIKKSVQNQTANGQLSDANDAASAVSAKSGETLKYVIEVSNAGAADSRGYNDMHKTVLKDSLPAGVELVSNPAQREITENLGVIKPGQKVTKEYIVRVTSKQDKAVVTNKACFTGNSEVNDAPQAGCDNAVVKVSVPPKPEEPKPEQPQPEQPKPEAKGAATPEILPETGFGSVAAIFTGISGLGYGLHRALSRKQ